MLRIFISSVQKEVVSEAIVNAVAHRDYGSNASVQVMLFKDRLEIWNPGVLPANLTLESLRGPHASVPANPLLAESMYLARYIERMGTGIRDMIDRCRSVGLAEPEIRMEAGSWIVVIRRKPISATTEQVTEQVTVQVTEQVQRFVCAASSGEYVTRQLMESLNLSHRQTFLYDYLQPAMKLGLVEMTRPDSTRSPTQKYRLTRTGQAWLEAHGGQP